MAKGQPFSVRLEEETERLVAAEAGRLRRSKSAIVETFTEDALRRPWVIGSGLGRLGDHPDAR